MSSGTFSLLPGSPSPQTWSGNWAGTMAGGLLGGSGFTAVESLVGDVAAAVKEAATPIIQAAYVRGARDFCKKSMWLKRNVVSINLTVNQGIYNFGTDSSGNLEVIDVSAAAVQQSNGTWFDLNPMGGQTFDLNRASDLPLLYRYLPEGMMQFYPAPNYAYLSKIDVTCQVGISATEIPNDLVQKFNLYLEAGALMFLYTLDKEPWFNPNLAKMYEERFDEGIGMARAWVNKGNQSGSVRATSRAFLAR